MRVPETGVLRALRSKQFAYLLAGHTASNLGDRLHRIALVWWVLEHTGSGAAMGTVTVFALVPMLAFVFIGGIVVDRLPRARVMIASDVARGVLTATIATLIATDRLEMPVVYAIAAAFGFVDAFFQPAFNALISDIVPGDALTSANSLVALSWQLTGIGGPALGALLIHYGGTSIAFALDAASFFVSAACLRAIRAPAPAPAPTTTAPAERNALRELREGLAYVLSDPWLWISIAFAAFANAIDNAAFNVTMPFLVKDTFGLDVGSFSLVQSTAAVGAVIGAAWLGRRLRIRRRGLLLYGSGATIGACMIAIGASPSIVAVATIAVVRGAAVTLANMAWLESVQSSVPADKQGRVWSIDAFGSYLLVPIGYGGLGWATDHVSPPHVFVVGGIVVAAIALLALTHPRIRRAD